MIIHKTMNENITLTSKIMNALKSNGCAINDNMKQSDGFVSFSYKLNNLDVECSVKLNTFLSMILRLPLGRIRKEFVARVCGELTFNYFLTKVTFRGNEDENELEVTVDTYIDSGINYDKLIKTLNDALIRALVNFEELYNALVKESASA